MKHNEKMENLKEWSDTAENKPKIRTNIKMKVTPEQSIKVQEICFENGCKWCISGRDVSHHDKPYLFIWNDNTLAFCIDYCDFKDDEKQEIDADLFIRTNGTCIDDKIVDEAIEQVINEEYEKDNSINNGGKTDVYQLPSWVKDCDDFAEWKNLNGFQFNILKASWTFNTQRHSGTNALRDINKIIHYANREKQRILKELEK